MSKKSKKPQILSINTSTAPNSTLRKRAKDVSNITDPAFQQLIDDMIYTCLHNKDVGIAAPQVHQSLRVLIIASRPLAIDALVPDMEPVVIINPHSIIYSEGMESVVEISKSIPGMGAEVNRYKRVDVSFTDREGSPKKKVFRGFQAWLFQHGYDYLNGINFLDHVRPEKIITVEQ